METLSRYRQQLDEWRRTDGLRRLRDEEIAGTDILVDGRRMVNLSSNDYMGIGTNTALWHRFLAREASRGDFGGGACSSRLLTGNHPAYTSLEARLAEWYGAEAALVFDSGYHANIGLLSALASNKDLIVADKFVHASLIDGIRLSAAECVRYRHNDLEQLEELLERRRSNYENVFIVTESVFSMDGDRADLRRIVEMKKRYDCLLCVDEAHAIGVLGERGLGLAEESGVLADIDLLVGTFGKAVASQGAFTVCRSVIRDYLVNTMRPLIFSTALPPLSVRWSEFSMSHLLDRQADRRRLAALAARLRDSLAAEGLPTGGESHIVPLIAGDNTRAVRIADYLQENGFFVLPIRTPTVSAGSERLRFSLTAGITDDNIDRIIALCKAFGS
jgi:8-amino-7-oxononanoate synthase